MQNAKMKGMIFRIDQDTGEKFTATAELLGIEKNALLQQIMEGFISSIQNEIIDVAYRFPQFSDQYPFISPQ